LRGYLSEAGIDNITGGDERHGAFLAIRLQNAMELPALLEHEGVSSDARGEILRLCPDCLTRDHELRRAAQALARVSRTSAESIQ
jgi:kynureninase